MQYNNKFRMRDLFMNKELKNLFPQFTKKDLLKNVYSLEWIEKKIKDYIKNTFNACIEGDKIIINGKHKEKYKQIKAMQTLMETMFNDIPIITKNICKNTRLITPFQCVEQLKEITDPQKKMQAMQIVCDNLKYNPDFQNQANRPDFFKRQEKWLNSVGYFNKRR